MIKCLAPLIVGIQGTVLTEEECQLFSSCPPAGFVLFSRNIETCVQTRELTDSLCEVCGYVPLIAVDQEGGRVVRTKALGLELPAAELLARGDDSRMIRRHAELTALVLGQLGFNMNLAPVLDIGREKSLSNALPGRCWGSSVESVVAHAGIYAAALHEMGMLTCGKHFPGLGRAEVDSHIDLPVVSASRDEIMQRDVIPFSTLMYDDLDAVMCAHVSFPLWDSLYPSSLSFSIIERTLRQQLGYTGLVMTDDLDMGAIRQKYGVARAAELALLAGNDLAMVCHSTEDIPQVVDYIKQSLPQPRWDELQERLQRFFKNKKLRRVKYQSDVMAMLKSDCQRFVEMVEKESPRFDEDSPVNHY